MAHTTMISGPHAIGKTATAKALAYELGHVAIGSTAGFIAKKMGYNFEKALPLEVADYQQQIAVANEFVYVATELLDTVYDRSPLDFATYLRLQLGNTLGFRGVIVEYSNYCVELTNSYCNTLIIPEADVTEAYDDKDGRPEFTKGQIAYRQRYYKELNKLAERLSPRVKIIRVPVTHQYGKRVGFILKEMMKS